jgi:hypothetical protein
MITKRAKIYLLDGENALLNIDRDKLSLSKEGNTTMFFVVDEAPTSFDIAISVGSNMKKVIASTDKDLDLPKPSIRFVKKYIEMYNSGRPIKEVFVEFSTVYPTINPYKDDIVLNEDYESLIEDLKRPVYLPKVNSKNNTIVIRKKVNDIPKDVLSDILLRFTEKFAIRLYESDYTKDPVLFKSLPTFINNWVKEEL